MPLDEQRRRIKINVDPELRYLIPAFLQHRREEIALLRNASEHLDYETIRMVSHRIKGVGGGYGFKDLFAIADSLEFAAVHENVQDVQNGLSDLADYFARTYVVSESVSEQPLVVCVDDEVPMLALLERILTKGGFRVIGSLGGVKALSLIDECKPDLIFMDIKMPEITGFDMCARLHQNKDIAGIPVIFLTGLCGESDRAKAFSSGASDVLLKPIDLDVLVRKAHKTLQVKSQ